MSLTDTFTLQKIGHVRTPFQAMQECPRNTDPDGPVCRLELDPQFTDGLYGLSPGDRILVLYWLDRATVTGMQRPSRKTGEIKGIFALRTPHRPNPIGTAEIIIEKISDNEIVTRGLDCLDMTPLLDIKPVMKNK
ncbi:MAG: tRNA (N6-threonylcarbamoyladenosine(37)-N6)-methyltransferase TrmO [Desulfuromonas sp.]|nr:MAG: tRNA (N6-threonylcarbamoyladenosine(37)-N6)-methyltransferase TrmO [Desulfuromonas sp.]